jgi:fluoride exporter
MMSMILSIAAGGAVGAVGRYLTIVGISQWFGHGFPYDTLIVNIVGSLVLGSLIEVIALTWSPSAEIRAFFVVGLLGAFTTFSTFSLDVVTLIERGEFLPAASYIIVSVILSVAALFFGMIIFRQILA